MVVGGAAAVVGAAGPVEGELAGESFDPDDGSGPAGVGAVVEGAGLVGLTRGAVAESGRVVTAR
ncbi:MAG TPA: hypothetical protein VFN59_03665 [Acidimicrobiales bacterium]|nr:hypothetical protein [Acidimicrobiales bacterium]